jgi:tetratricopeptide (TPR) repeat protein
LTRAKRDWLKERRLRIMRYAWTPTSPKRIWRSGTISHELATKEFATAREHQPNHGEVYLALGLTHWRQGKFEEALASYTKAADLHPRHGMTPWDFVSRGRGTPLPLDPPRALVVHGLCWAVRNPMALGFFLILIGEAVAFGAPQILAYASVLFVVIHLFIVFIEEPDLKRRFGASYHAYCQSVPRWLPRLSALRRYNGDLHRPVR